MRKGAHQVAVGVAINAMAKSDSEVWKVIVHWVERALVAEAKLADRDRVRPEMR